MAMNKFHQDRELSTEVDWLGGKLQPLREGKGVMLSMHLTPPPSRIKRVVPAAPKIVTITPGPVFNLPATTVHISVINNGSCFVEINCNATSGMVRAGIPLRLAKALLVAMHTTLKEEHHGNSTTTRSTRKKRPSSGAHGWNPPRRGSTSTIPRSAYRTFSRGRRP